MKLLLSTICIALLALFGYQVMSYSLGVENSHIPSIDKDLGNSIDFDLPLLAVLNGIEEYSEIVQRPLFIKDRAPAQTVNEVTSIDELGHLILIGTASSSDVQIAIIEDTKAKQMKRLKVGESYNKWGVTEVSSDHVIFQNAELEYKLFISPIKGSQKDKQAKLLGQSNKSKIVKGTAASKNNASIDELNENGVGEETKQKATGKIWNYEKKSNQDNVEKNYKPTKKSPIKIPFENEKDAAYYEGLENEENPSASDDRGGTTSEMSLEDYYDDEDITEAELKELQGLGLKIFND
jgi:hypothetical protein